MDVMTLTSRLRELDDRHVFKNAQRHPRVRDAVLVLAFVAQALVVLFDAPLDLVVWGLIGCLVSDRFIWTDRMLRLPPERHPDAPKP